MKKMILICMIAMSSLTIAQSSKGFEFGLNYGFIGVNNTGYRTYTNDSELTGGSSELTTMQIFIPSVNIGWWFNEHLYAGIELGYGGERNEEMLSVVFRGAHTIKNSPCKFISDFSVGANVGWWDRYPYFFQLLPGFQFPVSKIVSIRVSAGVVSEIDDSFYKVNTSCMLKGSVVF